MKESEFIELLNLYLDHEISAADAARLEAEVQSNPARRKVYQQYCRMQKACKLLAEDFQTEIAAATEHEPKVVPFDLGAATQRSARSSNFYTIGAIAAAAACVAIVFVGRSRQTADAQASQMSPVASVSAPARAPAPQTVAAVRPVTATTVTPTRALISDQLSLTAEAHMAAAAAQANPQFDWMRTLQFAPVQLPNNDALRYEVRPAPLHTEPRVYRSPQPVDTSIEFTAFRYQK